MATQTKTTPKAKTESAAQRRARQQHHVIDASVVPNLATSPIQGLFVNVAAGEYAGRYGVYEGNGELDAESGLPKTIIVVARDHRQGERMVVNYGDAERTEKRTA